MRMMAPASLTDRFVEKLSLGWIVLGHTSTDMIHSQHDVVVMKTECDTRGGRGGRPRLEPPVLK